jgi:hypothetical protein
MPRKFTAQLIARGPKGAWTFLEIPFDVEKAFGSRARVAVVGTINGFPFQNSLMPQGDGTHAMMVGTDVQTGAAAGAGDHVSVTLDVDRTERVVVIPDELRALLARNRRAKAMFASLSYSHRKEYCDWVGGAKKRETRVSRAAKSIAMVLAKEHVR